MSVARAYQENSSCPRGSPSATPSARSPSGGGDFLFQWGVIDYSSGYVIHLSSGFAGLTAAYWVGPRTPSDRERFTTHQRATGVGSGGDAVDGMDGVQRQRPIRSQHRLVHGGAKHAHHVDDPRRGLLQEAFRHRRRAGDDDRTVLHHSWRRMSNEWEKATGGLKAMQDYWPIYDACYGVCGYGGERK
ncbi:hypothetical protein OPV22_012662 [Ensete ventricosum]|uniref:Ammonium transporter AmtB-like domain-containing protein n=1 Tax=Ensete ventricosum TaxID=4639 RepID=A0AAV8R234_ENSVE|nr:hypothetical protein OPV22_012662 [Ensete ventricosum]